MSAKVEISKRLVLINSASSVVSHLIRISVLVWLQQYLLRRISPEEYSLYPVLMSVMMFAPLFTAVLTAGLGRYIVEAYAKGDEQRVTQIVSTMFPLVLGAGLLMLAAGWVFAWYVGDILTVAPPYLSDARIMMALLVFSLALRLPTAPFLVGLYVRQRFVLLNAIRVARELLRIAILFALLFGVSTRVLWVVVAAVSADIVGLWVTLVISRRLVPSLRFRRGEVRWRLARSLTSFGGWSFLANVADTIRTNADAIILNKLGTPLDVTCFYLGSLPYRQIQQGSYTVTAPLEPALTAMHATGAKERLRNAYLRGGRYGLWVSLFLAVPLMVYRRELITLYVGEQYIAAATVMLLLLSGFPLGYGNVMMPKIAPAMAQIRPWALRAALTHGANLGLTFYFVGALHMGAVGSAAATLTVGIIAQPLLNWPLGRRLVGASFSSWLRESVWPGFLPALAGAATWLGLDVLVRPGSWLALGACAAAGWVVYATVLVLFALQAPEREALATMIARARLLFRKGRETESTEDTG
jgi:O-antigen/teichoic acid export membrane protein